MGLKDEIYVLGNNLVPPITYRKISDQVNFRESPGRVDRNNRREKSGWDT